MSKEIKEVYAVVGRVDDEGGMILGIYTTKRLATNALRRNHVTSHFFDSASVEKIELNKDDQIYI